MTRDEMIAGLDDEIRRLETVRTLLETSSKRTASLIPQAVNTKLAGRRKMSPEGRQHIVEAQRRRWAKQKREESAKARKAA